MSNVYFTKEITSDVLVKLYEKLNAPLKGKVLVKLHSGEEGNQNYLGPLFVQKIIEHVKGTVGECNTAYGGKRDDTNSHLEVMEKHGWIKYFDVDILDSEGPDKVLDIPSGIRIQKNYVGKNISNYDSVLVLSHFKGHPMAGFGGALKQLSIGFASSFGKRYVHGAGDTEVFMDAEQNSFLEAMADSASSVHNLFKNNVVYISVMKNLSVDCDCCAIAENPCMKDIGILASLDPVALDKACLDLIYKSNDKGKEHFVNRVESRNGAYVIKCASKLGIGSEDYNLIEI
jgi:uncharacterized Fe-S center protein